MYFDRTLFDKPHHQLLELLAARALDDGDVGSAFKFADRRCRISPEAEPHCYILRAEATYRLGARVAAITDIARALAIAPEDIVANRRMLAWADGVQKVKAAKAIICNDRDFRWLGQAVQVLKQQGQHDLARLTVLEDAIEGWAIWTGNAPLALSITNGTDEIRETVEVDPFHPLSEYGRAASFNVRRPRSNGAQIVCLATAGSVFHSTYTPEKILPARGPLPPSLAKDAAGSPQITVIVPVYADYDATRLCLESLLEELRLTGHQAIVINDQSPDRRIIELLTHFSAAPPIRLITNDRNLGFVGSVNLAIKHVCTGDIILLNSDTIVPRGFIDRLAAIAHSAPDIGTVTPFSNNGEFVSFPLPNKANPLPTPEEIRRIDAIAAEANAGKIVDIPSGIGFCLYVSRACLDRVGCLSEDFDRGYLEDVDFCLRVRQHGFRNVCAPAVYIGHAGSKSFEGEKRSLVVRNLRILERRFTEHRAECAAFIAADPLRPARLAIQRIAAALPCHPVLLVTGGGIVSAVARARAEAVGANGEPAMVLEVRHCPGGLSVTVNNCAGEMPQSLQFALDAETERESLSNFVKSIEASRVEFLDPANTPLAILDLVFELRLPFDLFIADAGLLGRQNERFWLPALHSSISREAEASQVTSESASRAENWAPRWRLITEGAERILVPCPQAEAFATSVLPASVTAKIHRLYESCRPAKRKRNTSPTRHIGFLPVRCCAGEQRLLEETIRRLKAVRPDVSMTVLGTALDDMALMRSSEAFVTGAFEPKEFDGLVESLGVDRLFVSLTRPLFGHSTLAEVFSSSLPIAYFDWSKRQPLRRKRDLIIDPSLSFADLAIMLSQWIPGRSYMRAANGHQ
jgi:GT2 family glycosyltransferase